MALLQAGRCRGTDFRDECVWGDLKTPSLGRSFSVPICLSGIPRQPGRLPGSSAPHAPPAPAGLRQGLNTQSFRTRAHPLSVARGLCQALPGNMPARGSFPPRAPPRLKLLTPGLGPQASTPRGSRVRAPRTSPAGRNLPETPQICQRVGLDAPLQIATRSGLFSSFLPGLSAPRPAAARSPPASRPRPDWAAFRIQARLCLGV